MYLNSRQKVKLFLFLKSKYKKLELIFLRNYYIDLFY